MDNEIRRTLDELVMRYELEPELRDIYVEGKTDKLFLEWFLNNRGIKNVSVYEIDTVDISAERLFKIELKDNNRSRVIALALFLDQFSETTPHIICIADKDFDWLFEIHYQCRLLFFTDYSCLEMYLFNEQVLNKLLFLSLRISQLKAENILKELSKVLEDLFLIRATRELLNIDTDMLDNFGKCCNWDKSKIQFQFDLQTYIEKYSNKCSMSLGEKSIFIQTMEELRIKAEKLEDARYKIHGHDFTDVLYLYIKDFLAREIKSYNSEIIARNLLGCVDPEALTQEEMFNNLLVRLTQYSSII
ncbi:DUF4435 domain-containing protein [Anabaena catenula]|uniref:DUF4435 domain-containing protein n=1 Tax=Anabaena catenula FACHB-362 TaxID=2692877 RepID=A0ABR8JCC2_9NOST|nr:DUF4435 domain-containing protein [Anabaena catenula]MBD2694962.1 DUF4435 domain-containing protein [Anabaena catenula FACHB-362]